jgi:hypothetical protein
VLSVQKHRGALIAEAELGPAFSSRFGSRKHDNVQAIGVRPGQSALEDTFERCIRREQVLLPQPKAVKHSSETTSRVFISKKNDGVGRIIPEA